MCSPTATRTASSCSANPPRLPAAIRTPWKRSRWWIGMTTVSPRSPFSRITVSAGIGSAAKRSACASPAAGSTPWAATTSMWPPTSPGLRVMSMPFVAPDSSSEVPSRTSRTRSRSPSPPSWRCMPSTRSRRVGVPAALGGVEALESLGTGLLAAEVVAEAVPFADEREVAGPRDVAQLALGLRLPGALLLERAHGRVGAPHRPAPADERRRGERQRAEDQDCGVPLAHVDGDPGDEAGHDVRGDRGGGRGRADPARTAGRCRNARLHGAARLDAVRRRRQSWADSFAVGLEIPPSGSQEAPNVPFSPVRTGGRASFRREER